MSRTGLGSTHETSRRVPLGGESSQVKWMKAECRRETETAEPEGFFFVLQFLNPRERREI